MTDRELSACNPSEVGPVTGGGNLFESLKLVNEFGAEYWSARDVQPHLGYTEWRNFNAAVKKAAISCSQSGNTPEHHFVGVNKMIQVGKGGTRTTPDYHLSRFACYLIAQNGDSRKPEVARAQEYFAIQTRRMEVSEQLAADLERVELREQAKMEFKALSGVAKQAGVQDRMFGIFHDAGYKGMYGGLGSEQIKRAKKIPAADRLLDCIGTTELAANTFRLTQAKDKIQRQGVSTQDAAIKTHYDVGCEVRKAIKQIGGTLPEDLPAAENIKTVKRRIDSTKPKLALPAREAKGLSASNFDDL